MNKLLTRKKHSKIIAKLAFEKGIIDKKIYDNLYMEEYNIYKRPKKKNKHGYRFTRYYRELHYCTVDYFGEANEFSIIYHIKEAIYWTTSLFNDNGETIEHGKSFLKTKDLIKYLRNKTGGER